MKVLEVAIISIIVTLGVVVLVDASTCSFNDPVTGFYFDLTDVSYQDSSVTIPSSSNRIKFNPCKTLTSIPSNSTICPYGTSYACQVNSTGYPSSLVSSNLASPWSYYPQNSTLHVTQNGGQYCSSYGNYKSIVIKFTCDPSGSLGTPIFEREYYCTTYINWKSRVGCPKAPTIGCQKVVIDDLVYDLNPLASSVDYRINNTIYPLNSFYLNVCRQLAGLDQSCGNRTGICERGPSFSNKIGEYNNFFSVLSPGRIEMIYPTGSGCFTGRITFMCDERAGVGHPNFLYNMACEYFFEWKTAHACGKREPPPPGEEEESPCVFNFKGRDYDLTYLSGLYNTKGYDGRNYNLSPCKKLESNEPPFYDEGYGFQLHNTTTAFMIGDKFSGVVSGNSTHISVNYGGGDYCGNRVRRQFTITYVCSSYQGSLTLLREDFCHYYFEWRLPSVC